MEGMYQLDGGGLRGNTVASLIRLSGLLTPAYFDRFYYRLCKLIGMFADRGQNCTVRLSKDLLYAFKIADPYWNRLLHRQFRYEPEISATLKLIQNIEYTFLDLGANYGFWSVMTSSAALGRRRTIAVEPVSANFEMLSRNKRLNDDRFEVINAAITEAECGDVRIATSHSSISNCGASLVSGPVGSSSGPTEMVRSISIDDLVEQNACTDTPLVIKLDVEGLEIDALKGARKTLEQDVLIIYEDHGNDEACRVTEYMLDIGMKVFHGENNQFTPVTKIEHVKAIKKQHAKGYNLFASKEDSVFGRVFENAPKY